MCAHPYVRLYLQTGWTKDRGSRHSRRTADQLYRLGDEACWVAKELGSAIDSVCIWSCSVITVLGSLITRPILYRSTQSLAVWQPENNGAEVTIERGNVLQRMGECLPSSSANFAQGPKMRHLKAAAPKVRIDVYDKLVYAGRLQASSEAVSACGRSCVRRRAVLSVLVCCWYISK